MKRCTLIILIQICLGFSLYSDGKKLLKIGYFIVKPYSYIDQNIPKGASIELTKQVFALLPEYAIEFHELPFVRLLDQLTKEEIDGAVLLTDSPERRQLFLYPKSPYNSMIPGLILSKKFVISGPLNTKSIPPMTIGYPEGVNLPLMLKDPKFKLMPLGLFSSDPQASLYQMLSAKRLDAIYSPDYSELNNVKEFLKLDDFQVLTLAVETMNQFMVFRKGLAELLPKYEDALKFVLAKYKTGFKYFLQAEPK